MERHNWPLVALALCEDGRLSPVQIQKALFLIGENLPSARSDFYQFRPYHYGPFDATIYRDLDDFAGSGFVQYVPSDRSRGDDFAITEDGRRKSTAALKEIGLAERMYVKRVLEWVKSLEFRDLIKAIYKAYPKYRENSVFRD